MSLTLKRVVAKLGLPAILALLAVPATAAPNLPDRFVVGRDATGERCIATRKDNDPQLGGAFATAYLISCGGVAANRPLASVVGVRRGPARDDAATCGAVSPGTIAGATGVEIRRCNDPVLGMASAVVFRFDRRGREYRGVAAAAQTGPMQLALEVIAGLKPVPDAAAGGVVAVSSVERATLAAAPAIAGGAVGDGAFDADTALRAGLIYNRQGLFLDASRVLNDALSRLSATARPELRISLLLEAGLADSNIRFNDAAADHFREASALVAANPQLPQGAALDQHRAVYQALDQLNRRNWNNALKRLSVDLSAGGTGILENRTTVAGLNRLGGQGGMAAVVGGATGDEFSRDSLDALRFWAASVAYAGIGGVDATAKSEQALDKARDSIAELLAARVDPSAVLWLIAQLERQGGRIDGLRADAASGADRNAAYARAVARFDCALAALEGAEPAAATEPSCVIQIAPSVRARMIRNRLNATGPIAADTQMERAKMLRRRGESSAVVLAAFDEGVSAALAASRRGATIPQGLEDYLGLLIDAAKTSDDPSLTARYFRALQSVGVPGAARQLAQLQSVVTAGSDTQARLRDRGELGRQIASLRYAISVASDPAEKLRLEDDRAVRERDLIAVEEKLTADTRFQALDDRATSIADIQAALQPGEVYLKITEVRASNYAIAIGKPASSVRIYAVPATTKELASLAGAVRKSIRDPGDDRYLPVFRVADAANLFVLLAGPAQAELTAATAIVIDPSGPLTNLPIAVLVGDSDSVAAYARTRKTAPNDYSRVAFIGRHAAISTALDPASFLFSRSRASSAAHNPFIGFGQHAIPPAAVAGRDVIAFGRGCNVPYSLIANALAANVPIREAKLTSAATAFGFPDAPRMTGEAFTDSAMMARGDLDQFEVLHFATHGLPETPIPNSCASLPPSLLTSLGDGNSDGFLSFQEIAGLRLDANLVVLSACETSQGIGTGRARESGQEDAGKSIEGLVRAFLTANARAVVATYWKVSVDAESDALFKTFYSRGRTETIGSALRDAQTSLIVQPRYSHPYYWGAYFVVGDASKTMLTPASTRVAAH